MAFSTESADTNATLNRVESGNAAAIEHLLTFHRPYLKRIIQMRMEPALSSRVDAPDGVQETHIAITKGIQQFIKNRPTSFRIWIRRKGLDRLSDQRGRHVGAMKRCAHKEQNISDVSSIEIARRLLSNTPSKILCRTEFRERVHSLIAQLGEKYREVLMLRHAEELTNAEVAELLEIDPNTARQRYGRALRKLHQVFAENGIGIDGEKD